MEAQGLGSSARFVLSNTVPFISRYSHDAVLAHTPPGEVAGIHFRIAKLIPFISAPGKTTPAAQRQYELQPAPQKADLLLSVTAAPAAGGAKVVANRRRTGSIVKRVLLIGLLCVTLYFVWQTYPQEAGPACLPDCTRHDFSGQNLRGLSLRGGILTQADFQGADLREASLFFTNLAGANLRDALLMRADLSQADLRFADLRGANLAGANLRAADLRQADLRGANLANADLRGASLNEATLMRANLQGAIFTEAKLGSANLRRADLTNANLRRADLRFADLRRALLAGADFTGADLNSVLVDEGALPGVLGARPRATLEAQEQIPLP